MLLGGRLLADGQPDVAGLRAIKASLATRIPKLARCPVVPDSDIAASIVLDVATARQVRFTHLARHGWRHRLDSS